MLSFLLASWAFYRLQFWASFSLVSEIDGLYACPGFCFWAVSAVSSCVLFFILFEGCEAIISRPITLRLAG